MMPRMGILLGVLALGAGLAAQDDVQVSLTLVGGAPVTGTGSFDGQIWVPTRWAAKALGLEIKAKAEPFQVCHGEICFPAPASLFSGSGERVELDGLIELVGGEIVSFGVDLEQGRVAYTVKIPDAPSATGLRAVKVGEQVPDLAFEALKGKDIQLSDFRGRKLLIVNWASW